MARRYQRRSTTCGSGLHGTGPDLALDAARAATSILGGVGSLAIDQPGFVHRDSRDLSGFIDGTERSALFLWTFRRVSTGFVDLGAFRSGTR